MRTWLLLLGGLLIWAGHFLAIYILGSLFPGTSLARWLVLLLTVVSFGAAAVLPVPTLLRLRESQDDLTRWIACLAASGCLIAAIGVAYQGMTVFLA